MIYLSIHPLLFATFRLLLSQLSSFSLSSFPSPPPSLPPLAVCRGAKDGTLTVGVSGDQRAFDYVAPLLTSFTKTVTYLGPQPGTAHAVKAINNALNVTQLMLCAEGLSALKAMGADPEVRVSIQSLKYDPDYVMSQCTVSC